MKLRLFLLRLRSKWERCEHCKGFLRRKNDNYYGGIELHDTIGGKGRRTAYVCNLCYSLFKIDSIVK